MIAQRFRQRKGTLCFALPVVPGGTKAVTRFPILVPPDHENPASSRLQCSIRSGSHSIMTAG